VSKTYNGEKSASSANVAGKTGYLHAETETRNMSVNLYKYQLKIFQEFLKVMKL
jgi:hypothetical protein